jgi:hypothetical protein
MSREFVPSPWGGGLGRGWLYSFRHAISEPRPSPALSGTLPPGGRGTVALRSPVIRSRHGVSAK